VFSLYRPDISTANAKSYQLSAFSFQFLGERAQLAGYQGALNADG